MWGWWGALRCRAGSLGRRLVQLLELCALSGALLADADGVDDPVEDNDRLLLGLKGTMSEAELHLPQAADAGRQAGQGAAGEQAIALPTG
jgi:hypothetical protein